MIWLTWRQMRPQAATTGAALAALAVVLLLTGPGLADDYSSGIAACATESGGCSNFANRFFDDHQNAFLALTAFALVLPALIGLFYGAPLVARELEAGTHRLVWNQSITRTRWLAVKLGLIGLAAVSTAALASLAVDSWSDPIDKTAEDFVRMEPLLFAARGIVPIGYAAFAFALGVTVGMLVRRTLPAMAITLAAFVAVQVAMPLLVRPHLAAPTRATIEISPASVDRLGTRPGDTAKHLWLQAPDTGSYAGAWVLSSQAVDASGRAVSKIRLPDSAACDLPPRPGAGEPGAELAGCFAEVKRLGYRQKVEYHAASRFWPFQWYETGIYVALALGLSGFCFWRLRNRFS